MVILGVIPARFASTRFPGKPLALIAGRPMIQWVYEKALQSALLTDLCVATDDERIAEAVTSFGGVAYMTRKDHPSGSDRIAEAVIQYNLRADIIVNIQGDEPLIEAEAIDLGVNVLLGDPSAEISTLVRPITEVAELANPNIVKVVLAEDHTALYFSRSPVPHCRDCATHDEWLRRHLYLKHIGLYVYRRNLLLKFVKWPPGHLERMEGLEQLRLLERGIKIHVARTEYEAQSVDTPEDLAAINQHLEKLRTTR